MDEMIYLAFSNSEILGFCFDIEIFFGFLKGLYSQNADIQIEIQRLPLKNLKVDYQALYPMDEIIEFSKNVFITSKQAKYWNEYFEGFRYNAIDMITKKDKDSIHLRVELKDLDSFLEYLGPNMIQDIVYGDSIDTINTRYSMYMDYVQKIEDK